MKTVMEELIGEIKTLTDWGLVKGAFDNGLTYLCTSGDTEGEIAVFIDKKEYVANGHGLVDEYDSGKKTSVCTSGDVELKLISISSSDNNPVFTQAMADNGELPQVGMECLFADSSAEVKVSIKYLSSWVVVFEQISEGYGKGVELAKPIDDVKHLFKPIDTRTDKEKAIDDMVEHLTNEGIVTYDNIMLKILVEKFIGNKITGVKWVGE